VPLPSQILPLTAVPLQVVGPQLVVAAASAHLPTTPLHVACSPHGSVALTQWFPGLVPFLAAPQMPESAPDSLFAALHASHFDVHAALQHTPSEHESPAPHCSCAVQSDPWDFLGTHAPLEQK
jgi:hypothetical protein